MAEKSTTYSAPILYKAFAVLEEIARYQGELGISDIARRLDISKSTIYGVTNALTQLGALHQDEETKKFRLGPTLLRLGNQVLNGIDLRLLIKPVLNDLSQQFKVTVFMGVMGENSITIIDSAETSQDIKISAPVGTRIPILSGATGKVFLAFSPEQIVEKILAEKQLPKFTDKSITTMAEYRQALEETRKNGYAIDVEEYLIGVNAVCVPILDSTGTIIAAIWMVGFSHSFGGEQLNNAVSTAIKSVKKITEQLNI